MIFVNGYQTNEVVLMGQNAYVRVSQNQARTLYDVTTLYICPAKYSLSLETLDYIIVCNHWLSKNYMTHEITFDDELNYLEDQLNTKALKFYIAFSQDDLVIES